MSDPWMKFYPADWMSEPKLKLVSRAARSLWIDMLCLMHQSGTGRLEQSGRPMTDRELSAILGDNPRTTRKLMAELADAGVSTIVDGSFVASSRVIRDFEKAERDRSNGRMGGNPTLKTRDFGDKGVNPQVKAQKPEARSQSREADASLQQSPCRFGDFWDAFPHRNGAKKDRKPAKAKWDRLMKSGVDPGTLIAAAIRYQSDGDVVRGYGKGPVPWLNQECWNDDIAPAQSNVTPFNGAPHGRAPSRNDLDLQYHAASREYERRLAAGEIQPRPDPSDPFADG